MRPFDLFFITPTCCPAARRADVEPSTSSLGTAESQHDLRDSGQPAEKSYAQEEIGMTFKFSLLANNSTT